MNLKTIDINGAVAERKNVALAASCTTNYKKDPRIC
jgi:hypothetical protein